MGISSNTLAYRVTLANHIESCIQCFFLLNLIEGAMYEYECMSLVQLSTLAQEGSNYLYLLPGGSFYNIEDFRN